MVFKLWEERTRGEEPGKLLAPSKLKLKRPQSIAGMSVGGDPGTMKEPGQGGGGTVVTDKNVASKVGLNAEVSKDVLCVKYAPGMSTGRTGSPSPVLAPSIGPSSLCLGGARVRRRGQNDELDEVPVVSDDSRRKYKMSASSETKKSRNLDRQSQDKRVGNSLQSKILLFERNL